VKARTGLGGLGVERFRWDHLLFQSSCGGCQLRAEDLSDYLANRARIEDLTLLVQPALSNHPELRAEANEPLATARLVTGRSIQGDVIPIFSYILFGLANKITAHSNYVALVNVANGRLMPAPPQYSPGMSGYRYRQLPNECRLPNWDVALRHVKAAHKACPNFVFIGWDVAFTPDGPTILEGNTNWSPATYQTLRGEPLGLTKFADILATQLI
jgi:hypothetical protein